MIENGSILYRLPAQLDREQALFLDGMRHAAEIAEIAYRRLQGTLTNIAKHEDSPSSQHYAAAYLDAWAFVDAVDRFRLLWNLMPNADLHVGTSEQSFNEATANIRLLRNVADHLAQRTRYVVSRNGSALGSLSWFTITSFDPVRGELCLLVPGTAHVTTQPVHPPAGALMDGLSGHIHLKAGEHTGNLSHAYSYMAKRVADLESATERALTAAGLVGNQAGADLLVRATITFEATPAELQKISEAVARSVELRKKLM